MEILSQDASLIFGSKCFCLALYDRATRSITDSFSLKNFVTQKNCYISLWLELKAGGGANKIIKMAHSTSFNPVAMYDTPINFNMDTGDVWLDDDQLIIGVGDLRDGYALIGNAIPVSTTGNPNQMIFQYIEDNHLLLYTTARPNLNNISLTSHRC